MKVFISWSGERSNAVAKTLRDWIEDVMQSVHPFMSETDVGAGARWGAELDDQLAGSNVGIVCVTPENLSSKWLNYEAGALGKEVKAARVIPYLIGMSSKSEFVDSPLTRFQAKLALTETYDVVREINEASEAEALTPERLLKSYQRAWPELESFLKGLPAPTDQPRKPDTDAVLQEILETVREIARSMPQSQTQGTPIRSVGSMALSGTGSVGDVRSLGDIDVDKFKELIRTLGIRNVIVHTPGRAAPDTYPQILKDANALLASDGITLREAATTSDQWLLHATMGDVERIIQLSRNDVPAIGGALEVATAARMRWLT